MSAKRRYLFGEWVDGEIPLSPADAEFICAKAAEKRRSIAAYPVDKRLRLLAEVGKIWSDPESSYRKRAQEALPELTGFSPEMIRLGLDELPGILDPRALRRKLNTELRGIPHGPNAFLSDVPGAEGHWYPIGSVLHVLSGNVFLVAPGSLVEGILTGNVSILKMSSAETFFLPLFLESLKECDADGIVGSSVAAVDFPSSVRDVRDVFKRGVDGIVVWGGEDAVRGYRDGLPARTRFIVFGPKLSMALVTKKGLAETGFSDTARLLSREIAVWDQNACTAPQVCFVEGLAEAEALLEALHGAMEGTLAELPPGRPAADAAVEIRKLRSIAEVAEARGGTKLRDSGADLNWTLFTDVEKVFEPSPLNRTLRLVPYDAFDDVVATVRPVRGYLQTVGLIATVAESADIADALAFESALKTVRLGSMSGGNVDDPHDGQYDLPQLMNLVVNRQNFSDPSFTPWDVAPAKRRQALIEERLRELVDDARNAPFYAKRLRGKAVGSVADLCGIAPLTRAEWEASMPPKSDALATRRTHGGYATRSGGSSGEPKFSRFDGEDWNAMCEHAVRIFKACGLEKGDRLANLMSAGDLYGSFISFNHVNFLLGADSFPFAGAVTPETFLDAWKKFGLNAIQGVPPAIMALLRRCKEIEPALAIEKIMFAGQPMSSEDRAWLKRECGAKRVASVIGTTEAGQLGYQCAHMEGSAHHLAEGYNLVEILDDAGNQVPDGFPGNIAVTTLMKRNFPLIRYLIGDAGTILEGPCPCGRADRRMDYHGRADDIVCVGMMNLQAGDVIAALEGLPVTQTQLIARARDSRDELEIRVETPGPGPADLPDAILRRLNERVAEFSDHVSRGQLDVVITRLAPGGIARDARTGKVRRIVDERR